MPAGRGKIDMGRKMIVSVLAAALLLSFFRVNRHAVRFAQNGEEPDPGQTISESADPAPDGILKAVLLGDTGFFYCSEGKGEAVDITGVPAVLPGSFPLSEKTPSTSCSRIKGDIQMAKASQAKTRKYRTF